MMEKKEIIKMVKDVVKKSRYQADRRLIYPNREWALSIVIFLSLFLITVWFSYYQFSYYLKLDERLDTTEVEIPNYSQAILEQVSESYRRKESQYNELTESLTASGNVEEVTVDSGVDLDEAGAVDLGTLEASPVESEIEVESEFLVD